MPGPVTSTPEFTEDDRDHVVNINLQSVFLTLKYLMPIMISQGEVVIINTASTAGLDGVSFMPVYCASKAGIILLTKAMALECAPQNIRSNCIVPGGTQTAMTEPMIGIDLSDLKTIKQRPPGWRWIQPEEIARVALFLACDDSSSVIGSV
ncbi:SDR family NAD(P)-dependent oxidoreductase [Chloroflexota bacterium]